MCRRDMGGYFRIGPVNHILTRLDLVIFDNDSLFIFWGFHLPLSSTTLVRMHSQWDLWAKLQGNDAFGHHQQVALVTWIRWFGCWLLWGWLFGEAKGGTLKIEKAFKSGRRNFLRESHDLSFFMAQKGLAKIFTPEGFKKERVWFMTGFL